MLTWMRHCWNAMLRPFWHHSWRGLLLCALFAVISLASVQNAGSTRSAIRHLAPTAGPDAWRLSAQTLHTYADQLGQIAFSVDASQRVQARGRVQDVIANSESEIYRLQHAAQGDADGVLNLESMRHYYFCARDESLNLIDLPTSASNERRALQATMLTRSIATIHQSLSESTEARRAARIREQSSAVQALLDSAGWGWPTLLGLAGLFASICAVAMDWHAFWNREDRCSAFDAEYVHDLAVDGPVGMLALDLSGTLRWINVAGAGMLHSSREALIGTSFLNFVTEPDRVADFLSRLRRGETLTDYSLTLRANDGVLVNALIDATACMKQGHFTHIRCVLHNVTGRLQVEQAYRASERRLKAVIDHSPTGVFLTDGSGACTFVNQKWCDLSGMTAERAAGHGWADALHQDDRERVFAGWERCTQGANEFQMEYRYRKPDGSTTWVACRTVALRNEAGQITQHLGNVTDITQLKQTEQSLINERLHVRAILDTASDGIVVVDERGIVESANPAIQRLFGYTDEELIGQNISRLMQSPQTELDIAIRLLLDTADSHMTGSKRREVMGVRKDGTEFPLELSVSVMQADSTIRFTGILHDISDRKSAEKRLQDSEERFELAVGGSNDVVLDWNIQTDEVYYSPRLAELLGFDLAEMQPTKRWLFRLIHPHDRVRTQAAFENHLKTELPYNIEHRIRTKSGEYRWFNSRGRVVSNAQGQPTRMVGTASDITDHKRQEDALRRYANEIEQSRSQLEGQAIELSQQAAMLREANQSAYAASEAKGLFLANMSHEIRTPLNVILGMTQLALDGNLPGEQRELLVTVHSSGEHLLTLINDILDFSKIEAGKLDLVLAPFVLRDCVQGILDMFQLTAAAKGLALHAEIAGAIPRRLIGDANRLRQILVNLVGNAIKFTSVGEVSVSANRVDANDSTPRWQFTVRDTGIGIAADKLAAIFHPFEQADSSTTRKFGGTGLGLSIVTALVELMHGRAWVESELGIGSRFHFEIELPIAVDDTALSDDSRMQVISTAPTTKPLKILVVEDNDLNQRLVRMLLEKQGHRVTMADDGAAAVQTVASQSFDLILMDMQMPSMCGLEATVCIRRAEREKNAHPTPIIALTANAMQGDREECLAAGMNGYVAKPIRREELFGEMRRVLNGQHSHIDQLTQGQCPFHIGISGTTP